MTRKPADEYPQERDDTEADDPATPEREDQESIGEPMVADNEAEEDTVRSLDPDAPPA